MENLFETLSTKFGTASSNELFGGYSGLIKISRQDFYDDSGLSGWSYGKAVSDLAERFSTEEQKKIARGAYVSDNDVSLVNPWASLVPSNIGNTDESLQASLANPKYQFLNDSAEFKTGLESLDETFRQLSGKVQISPELLVSTMQHTEQPEGFIGQWIRDIDKIQYSKDFGLYLPADVHGYKDYGLDSAGPKDGGFFGLVKGLATDVGKFAALAAAAYAGAAGLGGLVGGAAAATPISGLPVSVSPGASFAGGGTFAPGSLDALAAGANYGGISVVPTIEAASFGGFNVGAAGLLSEGTSAFNLKNAFDIAKQIKSGVSATQSLSKVLGGSNPTQKMPLTATGIKTTPTSNNLVFRPQEKTGMIMSSAELATQEKPKSLSGTNIFLIAAAILGGVYFISKKGGK